MHFYIFTCCYMIVLIRLNYLRFFSFFGYYCYFFTIFSYLRIFISTGFTWTFSFGTCRFWFRLDFFIMLHSLSLRARTLSLCRWISLASSLQFGDPNLVKIFFLLWANFGQDRGINWQFLWSVSLSILIYFLWSAGATE